jgi:hypothetical protein
VKIDNGGAKRFHRVGLWGAGLEGILTFRGKGIMMPFMRTTLTLDPDVERLLNEEMHRVRRPYKQVVNDAIRRGLAPRLSDAPTRPYRVAVHNARVKAGIDAAALNRLVDELEDESVLERAKKR